MINLLLTQAMEFVKNHKLIKIDVSQESHTFTYQCLDCKRKFRIHYREDKEINLLNEIIKEKCQNS